MKHLFKTVSMLLFAAMIAMTGCKKKDPEKVAYRYTNGNIYTVDDNNWKATDMVVDADGKILYIGDKSGADAYNADKTVDLNGDMVTPGFINGHSHPGIIATLDAANTHYVEMNITIDELRKKLKEWTSVTPKPECLVVKGFMVANLGLGRNPRAEDIDGYCNEVPVLLASSDIHSLWINTPMINMLGYGPDTLPTSIHGYCNFEYDIDPVTQEPIKITGFIGEGLEEVFFNEKMPFIKNGSVANEMCNVLNLYRQYGYVGVFDGSECPLAAYQSVESMDRANTLDMYFEGSFKALRGVDYMRSVQDKWLYRGNNCNVRTIKVFVDGTVELKTASMIEPYLDGSNAEPYVNEALLSQYFEYGLEQNCNLHCHAIGDKAQRNVLNAYYQLNSTKPQLTRTIAHNQINCPEAIRMYEKMKDNLYYNSTSNWWFAISGQYIDADIEQNHSYLMKQAIDKGVRASLSDDAPANKVECINPMNLIFCALIRDLGIPYAGLPALGPANSSLTRAEALKAYTIWPAQQLSISDKTGSLAVGKYADFVIWSDDFMDSQACDIMKITFVTPKGTYFHNKQVY